MIKLTVNQKMWIIKYTIVIKLLKNLKFPKFLNKTVQKFSPKVRYAYTHIYKYSKIFLYMHMHGHMQAHYV